MNLKYEEKIVLKDVNATIEPTAAGEGQIVGFLGPSGIGKTSLLRIIAGLNKATSGCVTINGNKECIRAGQVGVVAQNYPLFEHRTVMSNLLLAALQKHLDRKVAEDKIHQYLAEFSLVDHAKHYPAELSGGQRQRVAILQQVLCSEGFLLMDEPFSGLDPLMVDRTIALIKKVANMDHFNTIIIVSHAIASVVAVSNHIWLMGRDHDAQNNVIPGAKIVKSYDFIQPSPSLVDELKGAFAYL